MNKGWKMGRLKDFPISFIDGDRSSRYPKRSEFIREGILFLNAESISGEFLNISAANFISEEKFATFKKGRLQQSDLVLTMRGNGVGKVGFFHGGSSTGLINAQMLIIRPFRDVIDPRFLYYLLRSPYYFACLRSLATGSAQPQLSITSLKELEVSIPPLAHQKRAANILSAYDDLIENNLWRIKILEEMAQNIYREWFVKFRFPGHQQARFTDSPLGRIPEGWEVKRLGDAFLIVLGGTPSRNRPEFWRNGTVPWINSGKVNDLRVTEPSELITELALRKSAAKLMPTGTTLIAITGATLGQVSILEIEASANQSVVGVISEDENLIEWLHLTIRERISSIISHASGGAQQHINKGIVDDVVVAVPPGNIAEGFRNFAHPLYRQIAGLIFKSTNLRHTRDLLLPRLISGEVDVSELDIAVPEEAKT